VKGHKNLTLAAYDSIKEMMLNYEIVPGQRLVFVDLAEQLGVSRTPVNNALSILAKEGYLDFVPNQGYSVRKLTEKEGDELYEIRQILELGSAERAIQMMTSKKLAAFQKARDDLVASMDGWVHRKFFILDMEFHASFIAMCENDYLTERYRETCRKIFLRFRVEDLRFDRLREIVGEHDALFEAVSLRDAKGVIDLIRHHNDRSRTNLFPIIFKKEGAPGKSKGRTTGRDDGRSAASMS